MTATTYTLASGPGWYVNDITCCAGPRDQPFEEQHETMSIAVVTEGTFQYRSTCGAAVLSPGSLLLGNRGSCFECGHQHAIGDRCLAFHFTPDLFEDVVAAVPRARRLGFPVPRLPALPSLMPLAAAAEAARDARDAAALEELALRLIAGVKETFADSASPGRSPSPRDARRITEALRHIEAKAEEPLSLAALACAAAMSPYHFLRTFRQVVGMTPHQYVLRTRMHRAAVRLRRTRDAVATIAFEAGFNDLSTFNHRFRRVMGVNPSAYRRHASSV